MKCYLCGKTIRGIPMLIRKDGKFVSVHRDCITGAEETPPHKPRTRQRKKPKALLRYREVHGDN